MVVQEDIYINIRTRLEELGLKKAKTEIANLSTPFKRLGASIQAWGSRFRMEFLSFMFFGAMVQKTFTKIATTTIQAFKEIAAGQGLAAQSLIALDAGWTYLKFTIGNAIATALEPLMPTIINIVNTIADWIQKNPELTASVILGAIAFGFLLFMLGQIMLTVNSTITFFITLNTWLLANAVAAGSLGAALMAAAIPFLIIALAVIFLIWLFNTLKNDVGGVRTAIVEFGINLVSTFKSAVAETQMVWEVGWLAIKIIFFSIWNAIIDGVQNGINAVITGVNVLINAYKAVARVLKLPQISTIGNVDLSAAKADIAALKAEMQNSISTGMGKLAEIEQVRQGAIWEAEQTRGTVTNPMAYYESENTKIPSVSEYSPTYNISGLYDTKSLTAEMKKHDDAILDEIKRANASASGV